MTDETLIPLEDVERSGQQDYIPEYTKGLKALTGVQFLATDFPLREMLLSPWLPTKGLAMVYAERGIGKTWIALNVAHAVASGGEYLGWKAPAARRVVYIDGEMPASDLQERYATIVSASELEFPEDNFKLVAADLQADGLPDLADPASQRFYDDVIRDADLIIADNLSTICRSLRENEADSFGPVQSWGLRQRAAGKSVLLVHHAGKSGLQRGTSRKEDVLDTVVSLRRPPNYDAQQGARFEVHFTKSRGFFGERAQAFEAWLRDDQWSTEPITCSDDDATLRTLKGQGLSLRQIEQRTGVPKSTIERRLREDIQ